MVLIEVVVEIVVEGVAVADGVVVNVTVSESVVESLTEEVPLIGSFEAEHDVVDELVTVPLPLVRLPVSVVEMLSDMLTDEVILWLKDVVIDCVRVVVELPL